MYKPGHLPEQQTTRDLAGFSICAAAVDDNVSQLGHLGRSFIGQPGPQSSGATYTRNAPCSALHTQPTPASRAWAEFEWENKVRPAHKARGQSASGLALLLSCSTAALLCCSLCDRQAQLSHARAPSQDAMLYLWWLMTPMGMIGGVLLPCSSLAVPLKARSRWEPTVRWQASWHR